MLLLVAFITTMGLEKISSNRFLDKMNSDDVANDIAIGRKVLEAKLIDYPSARFRDVKFYDIAICGYINSHNPFGGYTGWQRFQINTLDEDLTIESASDSGENFSLCNKMPSIMAPLETDSSQRLAPK